MRHKTGNGHNVNLEKFMDDIKTVVRDGEELLKVSATEVKTRAVAGAKSTDQFVRHYPYQTIGVLFGLGLVAGLLIANAISGRSEADEWLEE